ncbi:hypothetical protein LSAT2_000125 [Lamellibrachia satsuma]|nr:hypothetical protein LSAT2_000125 [Lamellibrachia satsuma]
MVEQMALLPRGTAMVTCQPRSVDVWACDGEYVGAAHQDVLHNTGLQFVLCTTHQSKYQKSNVEFHE